MHNANITPRLKSFASIVGALGLAVFTTGLAVFMTGCASGTADSLGAGNTPVTGAVHVSGSVFGGQQPVATSTIQLYTVGITGLKTAATPLLPTGSSAIYSDANGNFSITGKYSCSSATQVYITATGGNPGAGTNANLTLVAALGSCATLLANASTTFITMNEVTTVAAAYALAPFASGITSIGATGSNPTGLVTAFANAAVLANTSVGTAPGAGLAAGVTVPVSEINTLANILAACVNTTGSASTQCSTLFTATGATDTFGAALAIANNPGAAAITSLVSLSSPTAPFQPSMTATPNDFTVAVTFAGTGVLSTPYGIAIDASGNAWVTSEGSNAITFFSPSGSQLSTQGFGTTYGPQGIAIARDGTVWLAATASNQVSHCTVNNNLLGCGGSNAGVTAPSAIAIDSAGNAWVTNLNGNSVTELAPGGGLTGTFTGNNNNITVPTGIALDVSGNVYVTSGQGSIVELNKSGTYVATLNDGTTQGPAMVATDASGHVLATGFTTGTAVGGALAEFSAGAASAISPATTGLSSPAGIATDGTGIWVANSVTGGALAKFVYGSATPASPTAGFGSLNTPIGVAVDATGSVWTTNSGSNTLSKFIGLAAPVATPLSVNVGP